MRTKTAAACSGGGARAMRRRAATVAGPVISIAALIGGVAYASGGHGRKEGSGQGGLGPGSVHVGVGVHWQPSTTVGTVGHGATPTTTTVATPPGSLAPATTTSDPDRWVTVPCPNCVVSGMVCLPNGQIGSIPPGSPLPAGDSVPLLTYLTGPVGRASAEYSCPSPAPTPTTTAPPEPTPQQIWESAPLPAPRVQADPGTYGIAQLPAWFWLADDAVGQDLALPTISLDGYSVSLTVHPVAYHWSFGDGGSETSYTAGSSAGADKASATHIYSSKGSYQVGVSVEWAGSYTFNGYGITRTVPLGPVEQTEKTVPFVVQEVRSLLVQG